jgi:hypothetical protein
MYHLMNGRLYSIWRSSLRVTGNLPAIRLKAGRRSLIAGKYTRHCSGSKFGIHLAHNLDKAFQNSRTIY